MTVADAKMTCLGPLFKYCSKSFLIVASIPLSTNVSNSSIMSVSRFERNSF